MADSKYRIEDGKNIITSVCRTLLNIKLSQSFSDAIDIMLKCSDGDGKMITTGMGKAGIAMQKFSSILRSVSFPSVYIHPGESSHGDLGIIGKSDVLFVASTSGKTREVLETIDLAKNIGVAKVIGLTSHPDSPIREMADVVIDMGEIKEAGYLHIAPTTSIMVMLAITDCLALICAKEREITFDDYAKCHHSGYLGQVARSKSTSSTKPLENIDALTTNL
jgi:arabinose-5-phosphate isomerase